MVLSYLVSGVQVQVPGYAYGNLLLVGIIGAGDGYV